MSPPPESAAFADPTALPAYAPEAPRGVAVPGLSGGFLRKLLAFAGPGFMVAVGYMDPGNWATDIAGGSAFGYKLLSVILLSNLMAMVLQALAAKLGIVTGLDLAQACRAEYGRVTRTFLWLTCEIAIVACDLAEVIGTAIAIQLLFGLPLVAGVCITALDVLLILALERRGIRKLEAFVVALIAVVALCFLVELVLARPDVHAIAAGLLPSPDIVSHPAMLFIAIGIIGATVMPHNLYLHSSIVQTRRFERTPAGKREAITFSTLDSTIALGLALFINAAILILAAAVFFRSGHSDIADIAQAYRFLTPLMGAGAASLLFAVALLASGQNSTLTATLAGQIVMEGFVDLRIPGWLRRLVTRSLAIVPAVIVAALYGAAGTTKLLMISQVVLSLQLPFAVIPLVRMTGDRRKMGEFVNPLWLKIAAWSISAVIVGLNITLMASWI